MLFLGVLAMGLILAPTVSKANAFDLPKVELPKVGGTIGQIGNDAKHQVNGDIDNAKQVAKDCLDPSSAAADKCEQAAEQIIQEQAYRGVTGDNAMEGLSSDISSLIAILHGYSGKDIIIKTGTPVDIRYSYEVKPLSELATVDLSIGNEDIGWRDAGRAVLDKTGPHFTHADTPTAKVDVPNLEWVGTDLVARITIETDGQPPYDNTITLFSLKDYARITTCQQELVSDVPPLWVQYCWTLEPLNKRATIDVGLGTPLTGWTSVGDGTVDENGANLSAHGNARGVNVSIDANTIFADNTVMGHVILQTIELNGNWHTVYDKTQTIASWTDTG